MTEETYDGKYDERCKKHWEKIQGKLELEPWRHKAAKKGEYFVAVFGLEGDPSDKELLAWEKKVWHALGYKTK